MSYKKYGNSKRCTSSESVLRMLPANDHVCQRICNNCISLTQFNKEIDHFSKTRLEGSDYDLAFHRLKAILLDTNLYLHHKNPDEMLFIEVDASDVGWGACAYQMHKL